VSVLPDWAIRKLADLGCIRGFVEGQRQQGRIAHGLSSCGYDLCLGRRFLIFTNTAGIVVDPKDFRKDRFVAHEGDTCTVPPNSFALGESVEHLEIPRDMVGLVLGKSTYARCGICTNFTPLEPGWRGYVTVEIANQTPLPGIVYAGEGIAQVLFLRLEAPPERDYQTKGGLYQNQTGLTLPRVC
jgi:dCTP deaminase